MSKMLDAFIEQTYGSISNISEIEKEADLRDAAIKELPKIINKKIIEHKIEAAKPILERLKIPTNITNGSLNEKTEVHSKLKNYDHSLEINRLSALREKYNYVEPEHDMVKDIDNIEMSTKEYENIHPENVPNLKGIFDDVFGLNN